MIWAAMWPNIFAPSWWTLLGIGLSHAHTHRKLSHVHRRLDELGPSKDVPVSRNSLSVDRGATEDLSG